MGRMYAIVFPETARTAQFDVFTLTAASDSPLRIHGWVIGQSTEAGDAQDEQLGLLAHRPATAGSGGSAATPVALDTGDAAAGFTARYGDTAIASLTNQFYADAFNVRAGHALWFTPETRPVVPGGGLFCLRVNTTPVDSISFSATLWVEEAG